MQNFKIDSYYLPLYLICNLYLFVVYACRLVTLDSIFHVAVCYGIAFYFLSKLNVLLFLLCVCVFSSQFIAKVDVKHLLIAFASVEIYSASNNNNNSKRSSSRRDYSQHACVFVFIIHLLCELFILMMAK